jgi:hypothetical protein
MVPVMTCPKTIAVGIFWRISPRPEPPKEYVEVQGVQIHPATSEFTDPPEIKMVEMESVDDTHAEFQVVVSI